MSFLWLYKTNQEALEVLHKRLFNQINLCKYNLGELFSRHTSDVYSCGVEHWCYATYFAFMLQVFRLLRSLRPLRVINRAPGLKLVVQTLLSSLRPIGNIVLICCTFFIIFGILGVQVNLIPH